MQSLQVEEPTRHRIPLICADEYWRMAKEGLFIDRFVELIGGRIFEWDRGSFSHSIGTMNFQLEFGIAFDADQYWVRHRATLELNDLSVTDPDIAVVAGSPSSYRGIRKNPSTALLVAEVSESTVHYDQTTKASLYAAAGVTEYWILNIPDSQLEVRRDPKPDATQEFGFGYSSLAILKAGVFATPLAVPEAKIAVAELLPE